MKKQYGQAYFDKWYRDPRHRVITPAELARKVRMVLGIAEYVLGKPVRSVLDVGCGEASWLPVLRRFRPQIRYIGIDPSAYVVSRFGRRRNIRLGTLETLDRQGFRRPFDLIICCDVLNYLTAPQIDRGLRHVRGLLGGVAYLEIFTARDEIVGDRRNWTARPRGSYRRLLHQLGLTRCGPHCYIGPELAAGTVALERAEDGFPRPRPPVEDGAVVQRLALSGARLARATGSVPLPSAFASRHTSESRERVRPFAASPRGAPESRLLGRGAR